MKIKSVTDIITNSSSECFMVKTDLSPQEIVDELRAYQKEHDHNYSGMGGELSAENSQETTRKGLWGEEKDEIYFPHLKDGIVVVDIDWAFKETIGHLIKNYDVRAYDSGWTCEKDENGRVTERGRDLPYSGYEEWDDLEQDKLYREVLELSDMEWVEKNLDWAGAHDEDWKEAKTEKERNANAWIKYFKLKEAAEKWAEKNKGE